MHLAHPTMVEMVVTTFCNDIVLLFNDMVTFLMTH